MDMKDAVKKKKAGIVTQMLTDFLATKTGYGSLADVYKEMPLISKQHLNSIVYEQRNVRPEKWPSIRKAMKLDKKTFWKKVEEFYDGED